MKAHLWPVVFMFAITLFFSGLVTGVKWLNEERIALNQELKLKSVILKVLGLSPPSGAQAKDVALIFSRRIKMLQVVGKTLYVAYGPQGKEITGYALPVGGPGFWGPISGMVGIDAREKRISGLAFYKHRETPGLGGRMTEAWFQDQFRGLRLVTPEADRRLFYLRPRGAKEGPNDLDAITGATRTSKAIEDFLNRDLQNLLSTLWVELQKAPRAPHEAEPPGRGKTPGRGGGPETV